MSGNSGAFQSQDGANKFAVYVRLVLKILFFFFLYSYLTGNDPIRYFKSQLGGPAGVDVWMNATGAGGDYKAKTGTVHYLNVPRDVEFDLLIILTGDGNASSIDFKNRDNVQWRMEGIVFGDWKDVGPNKVNFSINTPQYLLENGTMYAHAFLYPSGAGGRALRDGLHYHRCFEITRYYPLLDVSELKWNLLEKVEDERCERERNMTRTVVPYYPKTVTVSMVNEYANLKSGYISAAILRHINFDERGGYDPIIWLNNFWVMRENYSPVDENSTVIEIQVQVERISMMKFAFLMQLEDSFRMQSSIGHVTENELEEIKRVLIDNPPWLLFLTLVISVIHTILDVLAFKNEIQFWNSRKSLRGLSLKSIYIQLASSVIVFLYLWDNRASWMVLFSAILAIFIELWKLTKAFKFSIVYYKGILPLPKFSESSDYASNTKQLDDEAMKYLLYVLVVLVIAYSVYSLMYERYSSWYSWLINVLAGFVYTFGFLMMTPQLFINYRLKTVAHLPWKTFIYKTLNTFIDDLFSFLIKMPTMHRLKCFRDDIVFVCYLYQRWLYPTDKNRLECLDGEMGQSIDVSELPPAHLQSNTAVSHQKSD